MIQKSEVVANESIPETKEEKSFSYDDLVDDADEDEITLNDHANNSHKKEEHVYESQETHKKEEVQKQSDEDTYGDV